MVGIIKLRRIIFALLLSGEILNFLSGCRLPTGRQLKVIPPSKLWLECENKQGHNLPSVSGTSNKLLWGLTSQERQKLYWQCGRQLQSALLIATKRGKVVPCPSEPLSAKVPGHWRNADAIDNGVDGNLSRIVKPIYGKDKMTVWMSLVQQPTRSLLAVPQRMSHSFWKTIREANVPRQPEVYYIHLQDSDSKIPGPLKHSDASCRWRPLMNVRSLPSKSQSLTNRELGSIRLISCYLEHLLKIVRSTLPLEQPNATRGWDRRNSRSAYSP